MANSISSSMAAVAMQGIGKVKRKEKEEDKPFVLLLRPLNFFLDERLSKRYRLLRPWESPLPRDQFLAGHALSVRAILCSGLAPVNAELLESLPCLGCVVTTSAGVDHIDLPECLRRGVAVANSGAIFSEDAADYGVGLLLDVLRRISASDRYVRGGLWSSRGDFPILGSKVNSLSPSLSHIHSSVSYEFSLGFSVSQVHSFSRPECGPHLDPPAPKRDNSKYFKMNFIPSVDTADPASFQLKLEEDISVEWSRAGFIPTLKHGPILIDNSDSSR